MTPALLCGLVLALRGDLAHDRYPVRAAAQARVERLPAGATPAVRRLAADPDPQVADWAGRELARRAAAATLARAEALMAELDPARWDKVEAEGAFLEALVRRLYADPPMALQWAALAYYREESLDDWGRDEFLRVFAGRAPGDPPADPYWASPAFGYWALHDAWAARAKAAGKTTSAPAPRDTTGHE
jgi:hypothetical protein